MIEAAARVFVARRRIAYVDWGVVSTFGEVDALANRLPPAEDLQAVRSLLADRLGSRSYRPGTDLLALVGPVVVTTALTLAACDIAPGRDHAVLVWAHRALVVSVVRGVEGKEAPLGNGA